MGLGIGQASSLPPLPEPALHPCFVSEVIFRPKASSGACLAHVSEQSCFMMQGAHMVEIPLTHPVEQTTGLHEAPDMGWNSVLLIPWDLSSCLSPLSPWKELLWPHQQLLPFLCWVGQSGLGCLPYSSVRSGVEVIPEGAEKAPLHLINELQGGQQRGRAVACAALICPPSSPS